MLFRSMNCIYNATLNGTCLKDSTMYVYGLPVCSECAKGVIQVGVKRIIMLSEEDVGSKWASSFDLTMKLLAEADIDFNWIKL